MFDGKLLALLLVSLLATQGACWLLARGLGLRLDRHVMVLGVLLPLVFFSPWLDRRRLLVPCDILRDLVPGAPAMPRSSRHDLLNDVTLLFVPWELEVRHSLSRGNLPLWSDALDGGTSLWVNPQAQVLAPLAMPARAFPIQHHWLAMATLQMLLAFEGTWLLCRVVGVGRPASLLAAAGFCLGGGCMAWALYPLTAAVTWVPWLVAGTVRLFRGGGRRAIVTTALITAALLLAGHPEVEGTGGLLAALCGVSLHARRLPFSRGLGASALAALLGFSLAAPQVLPFLSYLPGSQRAQETLALREVPAAPFELRNPATWFVPGYAAFALAPTGPRVFGRPFRDEFRGPINWLDVECGYAGLVALAGGAVALIAARRRRAWPFLAFAGLALLLAARFLPFMRLLHSVPPLRTMAWSRFLLAGSLALTVAGALGIDHLLSARRSPWMARISVLLAAGLSLALAADLWIFTLWLLLVGAALLASRFPRAAATALGLVLALDQLPWARSFLPAGEPALFYPRTGPIEMLQRESAADGPWRVVGEGTTAVPAILTVYRLEELRPQNPIAPVAALRPLIAAFGYRTSMEEYFGTFGVLDHPLLSFLNVRAVVSTDREPAPATLVRIDGGRFGDVRIYRNPAALPRWFIPSGIDLIEKRDLEAWIGRLRDPRRVAVFAEDAGGWTPGRPPREATVEALAVRPGRIVLRVVSPQPALVATSIGWPQGWHAVADGDPLPTVVVNGAYLAFRAPAGSRRVELRFVPPGLFPGVALAVAALLACAVLLLVPRPNPVTAARRSRPVPRSRRRSTRRGSSPSPRP